MAAEAYLSVGTPQPGQRWPRRAPAPALAPRLQVAGHRRARPWPARYASPATHALCVPWSCCCAHLSLLSLLFLLHYSFLPHKPCAFAFSPSSPLHSTAGAPGHALRRGCQGAQWSVAQCICPGCSESNTANHLGWFLYLQVALLQHWEEECGTGAKPVYCVDSPPIHACG